MERVVQVGFDLGEAIGEVWSIKGFAVQLDAHAALIHALHDLVQREEVTGGAVVFETDSLAVAGCGLADGVERLLNLLDGFLFRNVRVVVIGNHAYAMSSDVLTQLDMGDRDIDGFRQAVGVGIVEAFGGSKANDLNRAVGELFLHLAALGIRQGDFDAVGVVGAGPEFNAESLGPGAIGDQGGDVPIDAPLIGH